MSSSDSPLGSGRILLCSPVVVTPRLGGAKVYIEAAEGYRRAGWEVTLVGPDDVAKGRSPEDGRTQADHLREFLREHAQEYDVVEYEHDQLPFPRTDFPSDPLLVARSVLLTHCVVEARIPPRFGLRPWVGQWVKGPGTRRRANRQIQRANQTLASADFISLCNAGEREALLAHGHSTEKIRVIPFGLFPERFQAFQANPEVPAGPPRIGFVGTFDPRKGMREFPTLVDRVLSRYPEALFRLVGTAGMVVDAAGVLRCFPRRSWANLDVHPRYDPAELPRLLSDLWLGVFPSSVEGFPFGMLEMLAAGLPVFSYNVPGPPEMLPASWLVPRRDALSLSERVLTMLGDPQSLRTARAQARERASQFNWEDVARRTLAEYQSFRDQRKHPSI